MSDIKENEMEYDCPKHGDIEGAYMNIDFKYKPEMSKVFCLYCLMEKFIDIGVEQVTERKKEI